MPRTPSAAPIPAPSAARGCDAAFVVATAGAERVALALAPADRVGTRTPERLVELRPIGAALMVPTDDMADVMAAIDFDGVGVGVGVAETTTG
jgi:hypothetical protein